jgi:hypothetical protein
MRAAKTESTRETMIRIMASVLVISICFLVSKAAHSRINIRKWHLSTNT